MSYRRVRLPACSSGPLVVVWRQSVAGVERSEPPDHSVPGAHFVRPRPPSVRCRIVGCDCRLVPAVLWLWFGGRAWLGLSAANPQVNWFRGLTSFDPGHPMMGRSGDHPITRDLPPRNQALTTPQPSTCGSLVLSPPRIVGERVRERGDRRLCTSKINNQKSTTPNQFPGGSRPALHNHAAHHGNLVKESSLCDFMPLRETVCTDSQARVGY